MFTSDADLIGVLGTPFLIASQSMRELMAAVHRLAPSDAIVLITGESGTGKELVARAIHEFSPRRPGPWVDVSCTTLPEHLFESELFGYEKGAFSGALAQKLGLFELASGGTLFLDEIGDLDLRNQSKILRALDGAAYFRLGGSRKVPVSARIVAATNRDLKTAVAQGQFREDLVHRLSQLTIEIPPLRARRQEIGPLAEFFLQQIRSGCAWSPSALEAMQRYSWPGNVRQLRNIVIRAATSVDTDLLTPEHLPLELSVGASCMSTSLSSLNGAVSSILQQDSCNLELAERRLIEQALRQTGGNQRQAAGLLGVSRRTLHRKMKLYAGAP
ncbi:MAG: sigma-54-dependent Fis family transcriptional regulator [Acidimicrobiia bacterium]|nr:sigma-54-dependent Fis family transcriptional regulator [Acidimicrobiia bacterium]